MIDKLKNILIINAGGGFGDTVQYIPLLNWLSNKYPDKKFFYYANDFEKFYFENKLKSFKKPNIEIIKNFPIYFGFRLKHFFSSKKLSKINNLNYFDLIIDNQTKLRNMLIYKQIPHKYFFSPTFNNCFCNPKYKEKEKTKNVVLRIIKFLEYINDNKKIELNYNQEIKEKFLKKTDELLPNNFKYFGLSLVAGHKTRKKEFNNNELLKTIKHFSKNYIPVFFIEKRHTEMISLIKENIPNAKFPEHEVDLEFQTPELLIALANKMSFNISIDNGVAHLLALAKSRTFCFYPGNAEKFKPNKSNFYSYNCKNYKDMSNLSSDKIINFIEINL